MRKLLAPIAVLVLVACNPGAPGPVGPQGAPGIAADAALIAMLAARVNELEARAAVKVPWFVDGETHEPIGRVLDYGNRIAWSDELSSPVRVGAVPVYYAGARCTGEARVSNPGVRYVIAFDGSVIDVQPSAGDFAIVSMRPRGGDCQPAELGPRPNYNPFVATGATLPPTGGNFVSVEMR
jgi:hypothetical protein